MRDTGKEDKATTKSTESVNGKQVQGTTAYIFNYYPLLAFN